MNENELISKSIPSRCRFPIHKIFSILYTILRCRLFFLPILLKSWTKYPSDVNNISLCNPSSSWDPKIILITPISCSPPHDPALLCIWTKPCQNNCEVLYGAHPNNTQDSKNTPQLRISVHDSHSARVLGVKLPMFSDLLPGLRLFPGIWEGARRVCGLVNV